MKSLLRLQTLGMLLAVSAVQDAALGESTVQTSVENQVTVVRHGVEATKAVDSTKADSKDVSVVTQGGVEVTRRERLPASRPESSPTSPSAEEVTMQAKLRILAQLADLGLIEIRPIRPQTGPIWKYHPKVYHGYHAKPNTSYHRRPGWQYNDVTGWRYREEPRWSDRPGAVYELLQQLQLPMRGKDWVVASWK